MVSNNTAVEKSSSTAVIVVAVLCILDVRIYTVLCIVPVLRASNIQI